tara:strand:+ start:173 stop:406 length:234 start_codon:yes stop_codon:yes gene_type:complete
MWKKEEMIYNVCDDEMEMILIRWSHRYNVTDTNERYKHGYGDGYRGVDTDTDMDTEMEIDLKITYIDICNVTDTNVN